MRNFYFFFLFLIPCSLSSNESEYVLSFDVLGIMEHILYPSAAVVWSNAGYIITKDGEENLSPTTEEEWHNVEDHAAMVMESANLLLLPGRGLKEPEWEVFSKDLVRTGLLALFNAGGEIYLSCLACHQKYLVKHE